MPKALTETMFNGFKDGVLRPLLDAVQQDRSLYMEVRGDNATIYYRGGSIYNIAERSDSTPSYSLKFNTGYESSKGYDITDVRSASDASKAAQEMPRLKKAMDGWLAIHHKDNLELLHDVANANNRCGELTKESDYAVLNIKYAMSGQFPQFDMVALNKKTLSLALIDLRWDSGNSNELLSDTSGVVVDFKKMYAFLQDVNIWQDFVQDMEEVLHQKQELGLLDGIHVNIPVNVAPEIIFAFAGYPSYDGNMLEALRELQNNKNLMGISLPSFLQFTAISAANYGLYRSKIVGL